MNVFIIHAHAEPKRFNGALFQTAQETLRAAGHAVMTSDLYAMKFDPVSDEERQARLNGWAARLRAIESERPIDVGEY